MFLRRRANARLHNEPISEFTGAILCGPANAVASTPTDEELLRFVEAISTPGWGESRPESAAAKEKRLRFVEAISTPLGGERSPGSANSERELLKRVSTVTSDDDHRRRLPPYPGRAAPESRGPLNSPSMLDEVWDPTRHPRGGYPQNRGWWSPAGSSSLRGTPDATRSGTTGRDAWTAAT
jgi:hypothetical protein